mgnify:CR=1 FL=1
MSRILVRKQDGPKIAPTIGSGGAGISFILGGGGAMDPTSDRFIQMYGEEGSPSHERAKRMQQLGGYARLGLGAAGAVNSAYNQMASGQPGLGGAISSGAMSGYYGSSGLEDFAARLGHRFGRELSDKKLSNSTALVPMNRTDTSDPTVSDEQRYQDLVNQFEAGRDPNITPSPPPPADFTEIAEPTAQLSPPTGLPTYDQNLTAHSNARKVRVMEGDPMSRIQSDFGDPVPDETMDRIMERFG